jgi:uncharacterized protein
MRPGPGFAARGPPGARRRLASRRPPVEHGARRGAGTQMSGSRDRAGARRSRAEGTPAGWGSALAGVLLVGVCVSCRSYSDRTSAALADFQRGELQRALKAYEDPETTGCRFLAGAEAGTVALAAGDWDAAARDLTAASDEVEEIEAKALISPESLGETLVSWTVNETFKTYEGEGYERVLVHAGLALAYLARGELEDARVEVRRGNALLESEEKLYATSYAAGGLGHLVSAVAYELEGDLDDAYIDYRRMVEKDVGTDLAGKALVRLARATDREDDLRLWEERFGAQPPPPEGAASVVVIAGVGLGPFKRETSFTLPLPEGTVRWAVPEYVARPQAVTAIGLSVEDAAVGARTVVVEDVTRVAMKNLSDRIAWLAARSGVRAFLKYKLSEQLSDKYGGAGWLAGLAIAVATERADLRSWQTLPDTWQAARLFVPAGRHRLVLEAEGGERVELGEFELEAGETMFVLARTLGPRLFAYAVGGRHLPEPGSPDAAAPVSGSAATGAAAQ